MNNANRNGKEIANQDIQVSDNDLEMNNSTEEIKVEDSQSPESGEKQFFNAKEQQQQQVSEAEMLQDVEDGHVQSSDEEDRGRSEDAEKYRSSELENGNDADAEKNSNSNSNESEDRSKSSHNDSQSGSEAKNKSGSDAEEGADLEATGDKLASRDSKTKDGPEVGDSAVTMRDDDQEDEDEVSHIDPVSLEKYCTSEPDKTHDENDILPHTTNRSDALAAGVMPSNEVPGSDDLEEELKEEVKIEASNLEEEIDKSKDKRKKHEPAPEEFPHLFFAYGVDMLTSWLEELCEKGFRAQQVKEEQDAELQAKVTKTADNAEVPEISDSDVDMDCGLTESEEAEEEQEERGRRVPRGKQEEVEDLYKYYKSIHKKHSRDWSDQYQMVGLGRLDDFVWIIDEFGEAKIFPSYLPHPVQTPQGDLPSSKESFKPLTAEATKDWTDDNWDLFYASSVVARAIPLEHESMGWTKEDWKAYLLKSLSSAKQLPQTPRPSPKKPKGPHKLDSVYGIIYRTTPYLYALLQEHHSALLPMEPALSARHEAQLTVSYLERSRDSVTAGWNAPLFFRENMAVNTFVCTGMSWKERNKRGLKVLLGDMAKRVAFNKAIIAVCGLACPDGWIEDAVRQYVPVPRNGQDAGLWY